MFVLNHSDHRALTKTLFDDYLNALQNSQTGKKLSVIFKRSNLTIDDIFITNLFKCIMPREPTKAEYQKCFCILEEQIKKLNPDKIVMFGHWGYKTMFPELLKEKFYKITGSILDYNNIPVLITYHPGKLWRLPL